MKYRNTTRVFAVSSSGGHWVQLLRLSAAWEGCDVATATVGSPQRLEGKAPRHYEIRDATRWNRAGLLMLAAQLLMIMRKEKPDWVITTGAAPGLLALVLGKALGARTIWIDSMANVERISASGRMARWVADERLTQWPHLAGTNGVRYEGSCL